MAKRKHHYVPRFYLKQFASDRSSSNPRRINAYNIARDRTLRDISLRDQCYRLRFYGETNAVEDAIADLEGQFAPVVKRICELRRPPLSHTNDHMLLLLFVAMQMLRTTKHAEDLQYGVDQFFKKAYANDSRLSDVDSNDYKVGVAHPALWNLSNVPLVAAYLDDRTLHLLEAETGNQFVTSDNPVFRYNHYCADSKIGGGTVGAISRGLMLFLPLSPQICLFLYDGSTYKIGRPGTDKTVLSSPSDMQTINSLQFVGADSNLFWSEEIPDDYFANIDKRSRQARSLLGRRIDEFEEVGKEQNRMIHEYHYIQNLKIQVSFLSIRRNARRIR